MNSDTPKVDTCALCRSIKKKCDGVQPSCSRCTQRGVLCQPAIPILRTRKIDMLEQKTMALELKLATMSREFDHDSLTDSLFDKIRLLDAPDFGRGRTGRRRPLLTAVIPMFADFSLPQATPLPGHFDGLHVEFGQETEMGYKPSIPRETIENKFVRWNPAVEELPPSLSLILIRLFLPYRTHCHFYMDVPYFLSALSRPPSDPKSLHPGLLHTIHAAACFLTGGYLAQFTPHFVAQAQKYLYQSLAEADAYRLPHFLWGCVVIGVCFACKSRLEESYATISSCAKLAVACGLNNSGSSQVNVDYPLPLLPPPESEEEARDRKNLANAVYMADRMISLLCGTRNEFILPVVDRIPTSLEVSRSKLDDMLDGAMSAEIMRAELRNIVTSERPWRVKAMLLHGRVESFLHEVESDGSLSNRHHHNKFDAIASGLATFQKDLPPIYQNKNEVLTGVNPHLISAHVIYHGTVLLLYSIRADDDPDARDRVFAAARSIVDLCSTIWATGGTQVVRGYVLPSVHMLNAARVYAKHIQSKNARSHITTYAECCKSLLVLIDFLSDITVVYPGSVHLLSTLRAMLPDPPIAWDTAGR